MVTKQVYISTSQTNVTCHSSNASADSVRFVCTRHASGLLINLITIQSRMTNMHYFLFIYYKILH